MPGSVETSITDVLLRSFQRDFPLVSEPFAQIASRIGCSEQAVRSACESLVASGVVARVGGVVRPNTIAASTLAAIAVPDLSADGIAQLIASVDGINHVYLRENPINLWFVATGPDRAYVDASLKEVERLSGVSVLDLRLEQSFYIDLGFPLDGDAKTHTPVVEPPIGYASDPSDRDLVQTLTSGIPLTPRPFQALGERLGLSEETVIRRLNHLLLSGVVTRIGLIIRHRALGWRSNAMVVWDVPSDLLDDAAHRLSEQPGIHLCYRRRRHANSWPYNLYCMIHAKSRERALQTLEEASRLAGLQGTPRQVLFSSRCYKQTGALIVASREAA